MLTWKNSATAKKKKHVFFWGGWFFLHTLSPTGMLQQPTKYPPFWPYWGPVGPLLPPFGPGFSSAQHFHPQEKHRKIHALWPKGRWFIQHVSSSIHVHLIAMTHGNPWHILTFPGVNKKRGASFELSGTQKGSHFKKLMLSKPPFPPFIIAAMADIIIAICHIQALKKRLCITWKMSPRNKKNSTERQNVFTYIFYTFQPALPNSFPFPLRYFAQVTSGTSRMHSWIMVAFIRSWDGNLLGAIQLKSS